MSCGNQEVQIELPAMDRLEWSADVDEGMAAHREGRAPRFTGR